MGRGSARAAFRFFARARGGVGSDQASHISGTRSPSSREDVTERIPTPAGEYLIAAVTVNERTAPRGALQRQQTMRRRRPLHPVRAYRRAPLGTDQIDVFRRLYDRPLCEFQMLDDVDLPRRLLPLRCVTEAHRQRDRIVKALASRDAGRQGEQHRRVAPPGKGHIAGRSRHRRKQRALEGGHRMTPGLDARDVGRARVDAGGPPGDHLQPGEAGCVSRMGPNLVVPALVHLASE